MGLSTKSRNYIQTLLICCISILICCIYLPRPKTWVAFSSCLIVLIVLVPSDDLSIDQTHLCQVVDVISCVGKQVPQLIQACGKGGKCAEPLLCKGLERPCSASFELLAEWCSNVNVCKIWTNLQYTLHYLGNYFNYVLFAWWFSLEYTANSVIYQPQPSCLYVTLNIINLFSKEFAVFKIQFDAWF